MSIDTTHLPESRCLNCNYRMGAATGVNASKGPRPGDLMMCYKCGAIMMLGDDQKVRGLTKEEMDTLTQDRRTMEFLRRVAQEVRMIPNELKE